MSNAPSSEDEAKIARKNVVVKTEPVDEEETVENTEIKDYAETTMNELLGWYGYDKVGSHETKGLNLHRFTSAPSPPSASSTSPNPSPSHSNANIRSGRHWDPAAMVVVASDTHEDDSSTTPNSRVVCSWCQKVGMRLFTLRTTTGVKAFCSEICFTQCRRASFKKYKVCDWCKHIRHTVNYVDFQDGEQQLQFCSDKCLNQYKMNIFCRETQAHLQLHPHLQGNDGKSGKSANSTLITPDLWLRDCSSIGMNGARNGDSDDDVDDETLPTMPSPLSPVQPSLPERPASRDVSLPLSRHSSKLRVREKRRRHHHHLRPHNYYHTRRSALVPTPERNGNEQTGRNHATVPPPFPPMRPNGPTPTNMFAGVPPRIPRFPPPGPPLPGVPPITVMVPYPIVVPVPVPIPIPIPIPIPLDVQQMYAWRRGCESVRRNGNGCNFGSGSAATSQATSRDFAGTNSGRSSEVPGATLLSPTQSLEVDDDDNDGDCEESDVEVSRKLEKESQKRHRSR